MKSEKITRRGYGDACGTAHALELIGERWALLIVRELLLGGRRFSDLRAALPGISANVLTQRLEGLEGAGIVRRRSLPPPAPAQLYELTEWGLEAGPLVRQLGRWAARSPQHDPSLPLSAVSLMQSFETMFDPRRARGFGALIGFAIGRDSFLVDIGRSGLRVERGPAERADLIFAGEAPAIAAAVYGGQPLDALEAAGALRIDGDRAAAARFVTLFPLPAKAAAPSRSTKPSPPSS